MFISVDFPAPFSPNQGVDLPGLDLEIHVLVGYHAPKTLGDVFSSSSYVTPPYLTSARGTVALTG